MKLDILSVYDLALGLLLDVSCMFVQFQDAHVSQLAADHISANCSLAAFFLC